MATDLENSGKQPSEPLLSEADRIDFWRHYKGWIFNASDEEMDQLEAALQSFKTARVQSFVEQISTALKDEAQRRRYPESLMAQLTEANWPGASANG